MRGVCFRQPFFEFHFCVFKPRVIGDVVPLKWIGFNVVKFLATVAVVDVMKLARTNRVTRAVSMWRVGDDGRIRPIGVWVVDKRREAASVEVFVFRQAA